MPQQHRRITIKDVVAETGLSLGTVSGVLNGANGFAEGTRRRVLSASRRLNYAPNLRLKSARRSVGANGKPLTNIMAHITHVPPEHPDQLDPFIGCRELLLARLASGMGYNVLPIFYDEAKAFACPPVLNGQVDGVLAGTPHQEVCAAIEGHVPLVLLDVPFTPEAAHFPMVNFDIRHGMLEIARHMAGLGHRRVGSFFMNQEVQPMNHIGFRCPFLASALAAVGIELDAGLSRSRRLSVAVNEAVTDEFVNEAIPLIRDGSITALMTIDDYIARDVICRLSNAGVKVPEDVSVTGFGTSPLLRWSSPGGAPAMTSVEFPWPKLTKAALELLRDIILGKSSGVGELLIRTRLEPGETATVPRIQNHKKS